ncbi:MAG: cytochrome c biogenesis protein DipZ [Bdellovibrionota bacterium]
MLLHILAYFGGVLTIFSPCVLPVIPFLFSRSHLSFRKSALPTLAGMALSFTLFGLLSAAGGNWVIQANSYGRIVAMVVFTVLGLTLLFPAFSQRIMQPLVNLGGRIQARASRNESALSSLIIGASVGLLWAPCAGPILGLVLAGAALGGLSHSSFTLLFAFALGAATSLAFALFASTKFIDRVKKNLGAEDYLKKILGGLVLLSVLAIALGFDTKVLAKLSYLNTNSIEQTLLENFSLGKSNSTQLSDEGPMPSIDGANAWLNGVEIKSEDLKGKVVLIDFWTYSCINCIRTLPYLKTWAEKYKDKGLVVIGVHAPEFAFEKNVENVRMAIKNFGITYPVAVDNDLKIWNAFQNQYWPAHYFVDAKGTVRYHHFGEGKYEESEKVIQALLKEMNPALEFDDGVVAKDVQGSGIEQKAGKSKDVVNHETYLGYDRMENFVGLSDRVQDQFQVYKTPPVLKLKEWSLDGTWKIEAERVVNQSAGAKLSLQFKARDIHLVLSAPSDKPVRFRIKLDGQTPMGNNGDDVDRNGEGVIREERLYQLIRLKGGAEEHRLEIEFLDENASGFAFTFG